MADTFEGELDIIGFPKATLAELKAFPLSAGSEMRKNGSIVFCVETDKTYKWDPNSTETPDDVDTVLSNLSATGRWIAITDRRTINGYKTFTEAVEFEQDVSIGDDLGIGGSSSVKNGQLRLRDKNNLIRWNLEAKDTGGSITLNGLPPLTDILQGIAGGALNNAVATSNWILELPAIAANIKIDTNNSGSPNYFAGLDIAADGQTAFTVSQTPFSPQTAMFMLNGQLRTIDVDFTLSGTTVTWLDPVEGSQTVILKTTDELTIIYDFNLTGGATNLNQNGLIIGGYWNGTSWISNNPYINILFEIPDNTISNATGRISVSTGVAQGVAIQDTDLNNIWSIEQNKAATIGYGVAAKMFQLDDPTIANISTDGATVTVIFNSLVYDLKSVGDKIDIAGTTNYDGIYVLTSVPPSPGTSVQFAKAGAFASESSGFARLEYSPQPQHNQQGIILPSQQNIRIIERSDLADGYYLDIRMDDVTEIAKIIPEGSVTLRGNLLNGDPEAWTNASPKFPYPLKYETVRLRKQTTDEWWLEFNRVPEI